MKKAFWILVVGLTGLGLVGCEEDDILVADYPPATPQGVTSVTGDQAVYVFFNGIYEHDVKEYVVYRSYEPYDNYEAIGSVDAVDNQPLDLLIYSYVDDSVTNGETYWYAVTSVDFANQESDLSAEFVQDTPRPEGTVIMFPNTVAPTLSGYNLAAQALLPDTSVVADIFIDEVGGVMYINGRDENTDLQDLGYTESFDDISYAPPGVDSVWSENRWAELIPAHTYVIWTRDNNFAKMRVAAINFATGQISFEWGYQTDPGNRELKPWVGGEPDRPTAPNSATLRADPAGI